MISELYNYYITTRLYHNATLSGYHHLKYDELAHVFSEKIDVLTEICQGILGKRISSYKIEAELPKVEPKAYYKKVSGTIIKWLDDFDEPEFSAIKLHLEELLAAVYLLQNALLFS